MSRNAQALHDPGAVRLHGLDAEVEPAGDPPRAEAAADELLRISVWRGSVMPAARSSLGRTGEHVAHQWRRDTAGL